MTNQHYIRHNQHEAVKCVVWGPWNNGLRYGAGASIGPGCSNRALWILKFSWDDMDPARTLRAMSRTKGIWR